MCVLGWLLNAVIVMLRRYLRLSSRSRFSSSGVKSRALLEDGILTL